MENYRQIADFEPGDRVQGFFILKSFAIRTARNGKPYLSAALEDCSGSIETKMWNYNGELTETDSGSVVRVLGTVSEFGNSLQVILDQIRKRTPQDRVDLSLLVPSAPIDRRAYREGIQDIVNSIQDPDYAAICREMLHRYGKQFEEMPAAKSIHHSFLGGLMMHTGNMLIIAEFLADQYNSVLNRDLLLTGTLLHDFAKVKEFSLSELGTVSDYSREGQLLGHLVMGADEIEKVTKDLGTPREKVLLLEHMLLSHHGNPEFGAAVKPVCAEAELLYLIDMLDSRMEIYREALEDMDVGDFSEMIFALNRRIYRHT